ncbi:MAG TPA: SMODS domain-containing nucleotidyltransferase [Candidatus Wunengus sp. YC60]|uniref:SMODS domain-containing nucleotidyltransferase n=1 Tax=Candidatus Wunengus sp. YC60 TaxID=3367697 RepID=UPI00402A1F3D
MNNPSLDDILRSVAALQSRPVYPVTSPNVNSAFREFKQRLELREGFGDLIQQKHNAVQSVLTHLGYKAKLIGSLQRSTKIHPLEKGDFDIDILAEYGSFYGWQSVGGVSAGLAMSQLKKDISTSDRYDSMDPQADQPTVVFEYKDEVVVELVPAYKNMVGYSPNNEVVAEKGRGYWVPKEGRWVFADYDYDAAFISAVNSGYSEMLIPLIKMLKAAKRKHFDDMVSFHLEILATRIVPKEFADYKKRGLQASYPSLVSAFFHKAPAYLGSPIGLYGSHTPPLSLEALAQSKVGRMFTALAGYCDHIPSQASEAEKIKMWRVVFGEPFPSS